MHMAHFFIIFPVCELWWSLPICKSSALPPAQPTVCQRLVLSPDSSVCHNSDMNYGWCLGIADGVSDFQLITLIVTVLLFPFLGFIQNKSVKARRRKVYPEMSYECPPLTYTENALPIYFLK